MSRGGAVRWQRLDKQLFGKTDVGELHQLQSMHCSCRDKEKASASIKYVSCVPNFVNTKCGRADYCDCFCRQWRVGRWQGWSCGSWWAWWAVRRESILQGVLQSQHFVDQNIYNLNISILILQDVAQSWYFDVKNLLQSLYHGDSYIRIKTLRTRSLHCNALDHSQLMKDQNVSRKSGRTILAIFKTFTWCKILQYSR